MVGPFDRPHARARIEIIWGVFRLRRKLDRPHARARIEMVRAKSAGIVLTTALTRGRELKSVHFQRVAASARDRPHARARIEMARRAHRRAGATDRPHARARIEITDDESVGAKPWRPPSREGEN